MTDAELDRRVAEIVGHRYPRRTLHNAPIHLRPSDSISDAIAALEAMREKGWSYRISAYPDSIQSHCITLWNPPVDPKPRSGIAETLPLAICRAIVATKEK